MLWALLFTYPLMVGVQIISARIGRVTGHGLATNLRRHYPRPLLYGIVAALLIANTINIAADLIAMGDAIRLVAGGSEHVYAVALGVASVLLQVFIPYSRYVQVLKWLTLALFAYVATIFAVDVPWLAVLSSVAVPDISLGAGYITTLVAVLGTTISPYLFFWQASQEVEEQIADPDAQPLKWAPRLARRDFERIRTDTYVGMGVSNLVAFFIMLTTAVTLHAHGVTDIQTTAQAASALKPIAGDFAFTLFCLGIVGTGLLGIPVLAGSAAYAFAGAFGWKSSLEHPVNVAPHFYGVIAFATLTGVGIGLAPIDPIKALYWSAVINGVAAVPVMAVMMAMAGRPEIMGKLVITRRLKIFGWVATAVMALAVLAMFLVPS